LAAACNAAAEGVQAVVDLGPDFAKLRERAAALAGLAAAFQRDAADSHVRWIDVSPQQARLVESPLDIRDMLTEQRARAPKAWVFTSATLGDDDDLSWFTATSGLEDAVKLRLGSPFDYAAHARLYVPGHFPKPNEPGHASAVATLAAHCAAALGGRTFVPIDRRTARVAEGTRAAGLCLSQGLVRRSPRGIEGAGEFRRLHAVLHPRGGQRQTAAGGAPVDPLRRRAGGSARRARRGRLVCVPWRRVHAGAGAEGRRADAAAAAAGRTVPVVAPDRATRTGPVFGDPGPE